MAFIETVISLCSALIYCGSLQIILTCFLAFLFSRFMSVLSCSVPTASGLLTACITVPTIVQLRSAQISLLKTRKYIYTLWYKRLAIGTCTVLQIITFLFTLVNLITYNDCGAAFAAIMKTYGDSQSSKSIVDNVQWFMQCCGTNDYQDWYTINWGNFFVDPFMPKSKTFYKNLVFTSDTENDYVDFYTTTRDAVPFSCCAVIAKTACIHYSLEEFGTYTINERGCSQQLVVTKRVVLSIELLLSVMCLSVEIILLYHVCAINASAEAKLVSYQRIPTHTKFKTFHSSEKREFSKFLNESTSTGGTE